MRKLTPWFLLGLVALSACKKSSSDTYVVLDFIGSVSDAAPIASLSVDLEMAGEKSGTAFTASGSDKISLPTTATLRIGHGSGELRVIALAKAADGQVLGRGSGHGQVIAGQTQQIEVRFGGSDDAGVSGSGQDALSDGAGSPRGEDAAKNTNDGTGWTADGISPAGDGAGGGGGGTGGAGGSGTVVLDGGQGGRPHDANSTGVGGSGGFAGAGGTSTVNPGVPRIVSEPSALDFGAVDLGKPGSQRSTTVRNIGTAPSPALFTDLSPAAGPFSIISDGCAGKALGAGEGCTMNLAFNPGVKGIANGRLTVKAGSLSGTEISLTGTGAAPAQAQLTVQPTQGDFAQVVVGNRGSVVFTLNNTGSGPASGVMVLSNSGSAVFQIKDDQCSNRVLQPGASCTFAVLFAPTAPGVATGSVTIKCPDVPDPLIVNLSGTGKVAEVVLTVNLQGNGSGTISAPGLSCQGTVCTGKYDPGASGVSLTLNAKPDGYSTFAGWSGGPCNDSSPSCTFVLTGPTTLSAKFTAGTAQVGLASLSLQGHTGTISSSDGILTCSGQCPPAPHPKTGSLVLVATPAAGSTFVGWTEGPCRGANPSCTIPLNSDIFVSGTFGPQSYMFVTSTSIVPGRLGGLAGADAECAARAQAGGLPGSSRA